MSNVNTLSKLLESKKVTIRDSELACFRSKSFTSYLEKRYKKAELNRKLEQLESERASFSF